MDSKIRVEAPESVYHHRSGVIVYRTSRAIWVKLEGTYAPIPFPHGKIKAY